MRHTYCVLAIVFSLLVFTGASCPAGKDAAQGARDGAIEAATGEKPPAPPDAGPLYYIISGVVSFVAGRYTAKYGIRKPNG